MNVKHRLAAAAALLGASFFFVAAALNSHAGGLTIDAEGNLFASDGHSISKFAPDGTKSTVTTGLNDPVGLSFDGAANLFVSDGDSHAIYKFTPEGKKSVFAFGISPFGMAFDHSGNLFVSSGDSIFKFTPAGVKSTFVSGLGNPIDLAFDAAGDLLVADMGVTDARLGRSILKITPAGTKSTFASRLSGPINLAVDGTGNLVVAEAMAADPRSYSILKFDPAGTQSTFASAIRAGRPSGLAVDHSGSLFVLNDHSILKLDASGTLSTFASEWISPDKRWEYQRVDGNWPGIARAGTNQIVLDLSEDVPSTHEADIVWAPDSQRFAFNYSPSHASHTTYETTAFYQLRGDQWVALRSPVDKAKGQAQLLQLLPKEHSPKSASERRVRASSPTRDVLKVLNWADANTVILYARSAWTGRESSSLEMTFLFTLKFDAEGNWKVVSTRKTADR